MLYKHVSHLNNNITLRYNVADDRKSIVVHDHHIMFIFIFIQHALWANVQRDGRPAENRWRPLFNAAKFPWRPLLECRAVMMPRRETRWNLQGCAKLVNGSQPLVDQSLPYFEDMWRRHCCLTSFFWLNFLHQRKWLSALYKMECWMQQSFHSELN